MAIALALLLVIIGLSVGLLLPSKPLAPTIVSWSHYEVPGGPGLDNNSTSIPGFHFCAPSGATSTGIFAMFWGTSTGHPVQKVRLWTLLPPNATHPLGVPVILYQGLNSSNGGTSFVSSYPFPCSDTWVLDVESTQPVLVFATATLTYNYTSFVP